MSLFYDSHLVLIQSTLTGLLMALSIQVPLRMGVFSFAGAGCYGFGAYAAALLVIHQEMGALEAIALAALMTAGIGLVLGLVLARLNGLYLAMATVAFDLIIGVIAVNGGEFTGSSTGLYGVITDFSMSQMYVITVAVVALIAFSELGRTGRRVEAVRDDPQLAASVGVDVRRYRIVAFVVSGALGGIAGGMNVMVRSIIQPLDIGFTLIVLALTMIIVGGARSWVGAVIGAVIFTWLPDLLSAVGQWQELIYGILVAIAAVLLPRGIHGVLVDGYRWGKRRRRDGRAEELASDDGDEPELVLADPAPTPPDQHGLSRPTTDARGRA
ncbi:branched-chain amino acid ABC transporter permease [Nocardioides anomalus]|uniref:Branched-chain amino acid ABC transporter permease n=1 Tax=Nocardioides anomalus TaxID=2712223 RepID=A0A6G6WHB8_9ACTN|nr:branched-chain amino acid ABC transporter permease [Nocardioides anomalus]QIG44634.1 branched-chain amino acid ABC transporter permease [Nocardioides anomalus]